jgi:hypothetical protein
MNSLPKECPDCHDTLDKRERGPSRYSAASLALYVAAAALTILWTLVLLRSDPDMNPEALGGLCALPLALAPVAYRLPRVRTLRCRQCGWQETFKQKRRYLR